MPAAFDLDLLRSFAAACRLGSLAKAAASQGRAQSALSMQMRRLEDLLGRRLLTRTGRGVVPTPDGEVFLGYALRILSLADEAATEFRMRTPEAAVRIGLPEELAPVLLPDALARMRDLAPQAGVHVVVENTAVIEPLWQAGELDIIVATPSRVSADAVASWTVELRWVCGPTGLTDTAGPLDLVVFPEPCTWRRRMFEALAEAGLGGRVVFSSTSVAAVQAAVESGIGIALLPPDCIRPNSMRVAPLSLGLPEAVSVQYALYARPRRSPAVQVALDALATRLGRAPAEVRARTARQQARRLPRRGASAGRASGP